MAVQFSPEHQVRQPQFSDLSNETLRAVSRTAMGSAAEVLLDSSKVDGLDLSPEIEQWADEQLTHAIAGWEPYADVLAKPLSNEMNSHELQTIITNLGDKLTTIRKEMSVEDTVLLLVPYGDFAAKIADGTFTEWLALARRKKGFNADVLPKSVTDRIVNLDPLQYDDDQSNGFAFKIYLEHMLNSQGHWGIVLMDETVKDRGIPATNLRKERVTRDLGIAEWLGLTMQESFSATEEESLLLPGTVLYANGREFVLSGTYDSSEQRFGLELLPAEGTYPDRGTRHMFNQTWV